MSGVGRLLGVAATIVTISGAAAQGLSGPLAGPDGASPATKATKHSAAHRAKPAKAAKQVALPASEGWSTRAPAKPSAETIAAKPTAPADPLSFGMKWNGSNDNAAQTRIENLNGNATGTGAEVGMKLHF